MVHVCIAGRFGGHFGGLGQILDIRLVDLPFRQRVQHVLVQTRAIKTGGPSCSVHHASAAWSTLVCAPISAVRVSERNPPTFIRAIDPEPDA